MMALASVARAETGLASWLAQDTATGDWGGLRSRAKAAGLKVDGNYQTDLLANPTGGERQGFAYAGTMEVSLDVDLERIAGLEGTRFYIAGYWASGDDLSDTEIGNLIDVSQAFNGRTVGLAQMYLEQQMFEGRLAVALGRLSAGDDFATSDLYASYVSTGVNDNPFAISENIASFTADPVAQWGARAIVRPTRQIHLAAGVYNADPDAGEDGRHGVDFAFDPEDGVVAIAETGYQWNQARRRYRHAGQRHLRRLPRQQRLRVPRWLRQSAERQLRLLPAARSDGVPRRRPRQRPGPDALGRLHARARPADQHVPFSAAGGLVYAGLLPGRDDDLTALAVYYGAFSDRLRDQSAETVIEANHRFQLAPWLYVTPDFQYVIRPDGRSDIDDAAVLGGEIGIDF